MKRSEYEAKMKALQDEIEALKKVEIEEDSGRWKPDEGDKYYYVSGTGIVYDNTWAEWIEDRNCYSIGNCFKTYEEADFAIEKLKVLAELKEFAEPRDAEWANDLSHYYISYDYDMHSVSIRSARQFKLAILYFESAKDAQEAIEKVGKERIKKYYLEVE